MSERPGDLVIIGGHEDREGDRAVLREIAKRLNGRPLMLLTAASSEPDEYMALYQAAFADLGTDVLAWSVTASPDEVGGVFMSGGDQNRLAETLLGTQSERTLRRLWAGGAMIAGTSAGASAMSDVMLSSGPSEESPRASDVALARGLGLVRNVIVDQHFAERGRIGRLIAAVGGAPQRLGMGIDENTAVIVDGDTARVIGEGAVYVLDAEARGVTTDAPPDAPVSVAGLRIHMLTAGDEFDLAMRTATLHRH
jgi:cyanophycinase